MKVAVLLLISLLNAQAEIKPGSSKEFYLSVIKDFDRIEKFEISDPISDNPINTELLAVFKGKKLKGYIRELSTTTGCDSACLPLNYTTFYNAKGEFIALRSREGLTKKNHAPMTPEDYSRLEMIVLLAPPEFSKVNHPKELTDAISGETLKKYQSIVVPEAAYSTLRVHLYNQQTIEEIKKLKK